MTTILFIIRDAIHVRRIHIVKSLRRLDETVVVNRVLFVPKDGRDIVITAPSEKGVELFPRVCTIFDDFLFPRTAVSFPCRFDDEDVRLLIEEHRLPVVRCERDELTFWLVGCHCELIEDGRDLQFVKLTRNGCEEARLAYVHPRRVFCTVADEFFRDTDAVDSCLAHTVDTECETKEADTTVEIEDFLASDLNLLHDLTLRRRVGDDVEDDVRAFIGHAIERDTVTTVRLHFIWELRRQKLEAVVHLGIRDVAALVVLAFQIDDELVVPALQFDEVRCRDRPHVRLERQDVLTTDALLANHSDVQVLKLP